MIGGGEEMMTMGVRSLAWMVLLAMCMGGVSERAHAEMYEVEPTHAAVNFSIQHLGMSVVRGRFSGVTGELNLDKKDLGQSWIRVRVDVASIDTGHDARDKHLRGEDFFNVAKYPTMTFKSQSVEATGREGEYRIRGQLTFLGKTKTLEVTARKLGEGADPWGGYRVGFTVTFQIRRSEFGMGYGVKAVSYTHLRAHETVLDLVCRLLLEKKNR